MGDQPLGRDPIAPTGEFAAFRREQDTSELLRRQLHGEAPPEGHRPWPLAPQVVVAAIGGTIAVSVIAFLNSLRLGQARTARWAVIGLAALGLAVVTAVTVVLTGEAAGAAQVRTARIAGGLVAIALHLALAAVQRPADRIYGREVGLYDSLRLPGALAVVGGALGESLFVVAVASAL